MLLCLSWTIPARRMRDAGREKHQINLKNARHC